MELLDTCLFNVLVKDDELRDGWVARRTGCFGRKRKSQRVASRKRSYRLGRCFTVPEFSLECMSWRSYRQHPRRVSPRWLLGFHDVMPAREA